MRNPIPGWTEHWLEKTMVVTYTSRLQDDDLGCYNTAGKQLFLCPDRSGGAVLAETRLVIPATPLRDMTSALWQTKFDKLRRRLAKEFLKNGGIVRYIHVHFTIPGLSPEEHHVITMRVTASGLEGFFKSTNSWSHMRWLFGSESPVDPLQHLTQMEVENYLRELWTRQQTVKLELLNRSQLPDALLDSALIPFINYQRTI